MVIDTNYSRISIVVIDDNIRNKNNMINESVNILKELSFIHIPKTGGTTIETITKNNKCCKWGKNYWNEYLFKKEISQKICEKRKCCCQWIWHIPPFYIYDIMNNTSSSYYYDLNKKDLFTIIRNPYLKLISEYYHQIRANWQREIIIKYLKSIGLWYNNNNNNNNNNWCDSDIFNAWIRFRLNMTNYKNINKYNLWNNECISNCHLIPQWRFCFNQYKNISICKYILHQENLKNEFNQLMKIYNLNNIININNYTNNNNINKNKNKIKKICLNVQPNKINKYEMKLFINAYYYDFILFGYDINNINITYN